MENQINSSKKSLKDTLISPIVSLLSYDNYSAFVPPFSLGTWIFFLGGFVGSLIVGWVIYPMVLYSSQPQPMNFSHAVHMNPEKVDGVEGETEIEKCIFCTLCAKKCPTDALEVDREKKTWVINRMRCITCGACVDVCPKKCLIMDNCYMEPQLIQEKETHTGA